MRDGNIQQAIDLYQRSLQLEPSLACNHLSLAAGYVALCRDGEAAGHLRRYLEAQPEHHTVRGYYAEVLLRLQRAKEARVEFERFIAGIQEDHDLAARHLIHCHSRLLEIALSEGDDYAVHLQRGIGFYLLALERGHLLSSNTTLSAEALLCQAAGELSLAWRARPEEARPCWYLYEVWSRLAQIQPAARWLHAAEAAMPFSYLTPHERAALQLACRQRNDALACYAKR
jgi:hypothetical protein